MQIIHHLQIDLARRMPAPPVSAVQNDANARHVAIELLENGSPWEVGKLCFWPYLVGALIIWRLGDGTDSRGGHCVLLVGMPLAMTALAYCLPGAVPVLRYAVPAGGIALYALVLRRRLWGGEPTGRPSMTRE